MIGCGACESATNWLNDLVSNDGLVNTVVTVLKVVMLPSYSWTQLNIIFDGYVPSVLNGLRNKLFNAKIMCQVKIPLCYNTDYRELYVEDYVDRVLFDKPSILRNDDFIDNLYQEISDDKAKGIERETVTMYHLADLHIDLKYTPGAKRANCGDIMCCRGAVAKKESDRAGKWGDYNCDLPIWTLKQIHHSVKEAGEPDFIVWTGDNVAHDVLKSAFESAESTLLITQYVKENYPNAIVYPIQGNHEFSPMNLQDLSEENNMVIDMISNVWRDWMTPDVYEQFRKKSFYDNLASNHPKATEELKSKMEGTRIIAMNLQSCYFFNFYLFSELGDELHELDWLEKTFREMEIKGEKAIVIAHIPPGAHDCMEPFSRRY